MAVDDDDPAIDILIPDVSLHDVGLAGARERSSVQTTTPTLTAPIMMIDEIREAYIEIRSGTDGRVVTVIEILSPTDKVFGSGLRSSYLDKRRLLLQSDAHFVEIDLLRGGERASPLGARIPVSDYRIAVSPVGQRPMATYWLVNMRDPLPTIKIPLVEGDAPVGLDLHAALNRVYDQARYDLQVDYSAAPPAPELAGEDGEWMNSLLAESGKRSGG